MAMTLRQALILTICRDHNMPALLCDVRRGAKTRYSPNVLSDSCTSWSAFLFRGCWSVGWCLYVGVDSLKTSFQRGLKRSVFNDLCSFILLPLRLPWRPLNLPCKQSVWNKSLVCGPCLLCLVVVREVDFRGGRNPCVWSFRIWWRCYGTSTTLALH